MDYLDEIRKANEDQLGKIDAMWNGEINGETDLEKARKELTGGRWVIIDGRHVYMGSDGEVKAGAVYNKDGSRETASGTSKVGDSGGEENKEEEYLSKFTKDIKAHGSTLQEGLKRYRAGKKGEDTALIGRLLDARKAKKVEDIGKEQSEKKEDKPFNESDKKVLDHVNSLPAGTIVYGVNKNDIAKVINDPDKTHGWDNDHFNKVDDAIDKINTSLKKTGDVPNIMGEKKDSGEKKSEPKKESNPEKAYKDADTFSKLDFSKDAGYEKTENIKKLHDEYKKLDTAKLSDKTRDSLNTISNDLYMGAHTGKYDGGKDIEFHRMEVGDALQEVMKVNDYLTKEEDEYSISEEGFNKIHQTIASALKEQAKKDTTDKLQYKLFKSIMNYQDEIQKANTDQMNKIDGLWKCDDIKKKEEAVEDELNEEDKNKLIKKAVESGDLSDLSDEIGKALTTVLEAKEDGSLAELLKGGKVAQIGETRMHGGKKMKKTAKGWEPAGEGGEKGKGEKKDSPDDSDKIEKFYQNMLWSIGEDKHFATKEIAIYALRENGKNRKKAGKTAESKMMFDVADKLEGGGKNTNKLDGFKSDVRDELKRMDYTDDQIDKKLKKESNFLKEASEQNQHYTKVAQQLR